MFRRPARIFAPLALVACAVAVLAIVNTNNKSGSKGSTSTPTQTSTVSTTAKQTSKKTRHSYIVKNGDVLSAISIKTGVSMLTIKRLNPKIQADTLHAGQRVRLSR